MRTLPATIATLLLATAGCADYQNFNCFRCGNFVTYTRTGEAPCRECGRTNVVGQCPACGRVEPQPGYGELKCSGCARKYFATKCRSCNACYFSQSPKETCPLCGAAAGTSDEAVLLNQARTKVEKGELEGAIGDCSGIISRNAAYRPALLLRARIYSDRGDFEAASRDYERALSLDPRDGDAQYRAACAAARLGQSARALDHLELAVKFGFANWDLLRKDEDLSPLRSDPRYRRLLEQAPK